MRSKLMAGTAFVALTLAGVPVLAQDQQDPATQPIPPAGEAPAEAQGAEAPAAGEEGTSAEAPEDQQSDDMAATADADDSEMFITAQDPQQAMANDMIGAQLLGADDTAIGSVSDLVLDAQRKVTAAVVGVGGFLGIGQKNVAIDIDQIDEVSDEAGRVVFRVDASEQELEQAPEFVTVAEQQAAAPAVPPAGDAAPGVVPPPTEPPAATQ